MLHTRYLFPKRHEAFIEQANLYHPAIKFTAETFDTETAFLDTVAYKGTRFKEKSILDAKTYFKQTETFWHTHFTSCHPPSVQKGFVIGEVSRPYRCAACHPLHFLAQQVVSSLAIIPAGCVLYNKCGQLSR